MPGSMTGCFSVSVIQKVRLFRKRIVCKGVGVPLSLCNFDLYEQTKLSQRNHNWRPHVQFSVCRLWDSFMTAPMCQFGKNRVQHRTFEWQYLPTDHAEVYYYQGGKSYAGQITAHLSDWIEDVESLYDRKLDGAVQVLVFNKQTEFRQSNIGSNNDPTNNIGGIATPGGLQNFHLPRWRMGTYRTTC